MLWGFAFLVYTQDIVLIVVVVIIKRCVVFREIQRLKRGGRKRFSLRTHATSHVR
jgi:hypothetical protein